MGLMIVDWKWFRNNTEIARNGRENQTFLHVQELEVDPAPLVRWRAGTESGRPWWFVVTGVVGGEQVEQRWQGSLGLRKSADRYGLESRTLLFRSTASRMNLGSILRVMGRHRFWEYKFWTAVRKISEARILKGWNVSQRQRPWSNVEGLVPSSVPQNN